MIRGKIETMLHKRVNLSEVEIAEQAGMSVQTYHYKLRRNSFTILDLERIAKVLRCELVIEFLDKPV